MSDSKSSSGGIGFCGLLTIVFITLKLCKVIDWLWWWVLSPIWIPAAIGIIAFIVWIIIKAREKKDTLDRISSGYNEHAWKNGGKSKWQERMEQMQEAQKKRV